MCSPSWTPSHLPPHLIPQGHPSAPALSTLSHASNLDWWSISHMIKYVFQCYSLKSSHPRLLPESKRLFLTSVFLLLSHTQGYHYHLSKFHIYALICCIGGEGKGTLLQYSCLENPIGGGDWWAAIQGLRRVGDDWVTSLSLFTFMHWRRKWQPTPVFLPGESQGRGSLVGCRLWGHTESYTTEVI